MNTLNKIEMLILLEGKLLNFMQCGCIQAAMTLKSRAVRALTCLCAQVQLLSDNI